MFASKNQYQKSKTTKHVKVLANQSLSKFKGAPCLSVNVVAKKWSKTGSHNGTEQHSRQVCCLHTENDTSVGYLPKGPNAKSLVPVQEKAIFGV